MKDVKAALTANGASDEEVKAFEKGASAFAKKILSNFSDYEFVCQILPREVHTNARK
jgi:hypothetical protein